jgi:two-component system sensor histidine kinase RegB
VRTFLNDLVEEWRSTRAANAFTYEDAFGDDLPMVSDSALKQMVCNVLDNALEASRYSVGLKAAREADALVLTISDAGPGFSTAMLSQFGKPYQTSKGRPGGGLGLFLVVNVARTLGGKVDAQNATEGGARVTLTLPLSSITLDEEEQAHVD